MKLYTYNENTTRKGQVFRGEDSEAEDNGDVSLWGEGSEQELIAMALEILAGPCGGAPHFGHRTARNVLQFLGGPHVECHYEAGRGSYWLPVAAEQEAD